MKKQFTVGSLFAGAGGIDLGLLGAQNDDAEFIPAWANEIDEYACETYRTNFPHPLFEGDIRMILHPENAPGNNRDYYEGLHAAILENPVDVLAGGFPCQAFSIAGEKRGFEDERGNLFLAFPDLILQLYEKHKKKPRFLFLENVRNLISHDHGNTYRVIKKKLEETGYIIKEAVLNTMYYSDLPQNRERIYIIGFLNKEDAEKFDMFDRLPDFAKVRTDDEKKEDIKNILDFSVSDEKYFYTKEKYPQYFPGHTAEDGTNKGSNVITRADLPGGITQMYSFYQIRYGKNLRKNQSGVCFTLTANMGTGGHNVPLILTPSGIRKITPKEAFRLQGFPVGIPVSYLNGKEKGYLFPETYKGKKFSDSHLYKQAGNAVSVPVISLIAKEILKTIS